MVDQVSSSSPASQNKPSPAVLDTVRAQSLQQAGSLIKGMFDRLEGIVFEWAKVASDSEQQSHMDVIVASRRMRQDMESRFVSEVSTGFMNLQKKSATKGNRGLGGIDFDSLSLVDTDEMDVTVVIDVMVAKARLDFAAPLGLLRRRFSHVLPQTDMAERHLPLDPGAICHAFKMALALLDVNVPEKLLVLRVFQQQVLGELATLLNAANQTFIDAGVLPELKLGFASTATTAKKPEKSAKAEAKDKPADTEEIFSFLQSVMGRFAGGAGAESAIPGVPSAGAGAMPGAQFHGGQYVGGGGIGALPASVVGGSVAAVPIAPLHIAPTAVVQTVATPELVNLLSQIQQMQPKASLVEDDSTPSVEDIRGNIRDSLRSDDETVEAIKRADEDVINLVSMLFDFILDDDDLPMAMKAVIGRLQIPLLKVAILDKSFFNAETHSARRLLNALAKAGIGWSSKDPKGDVLYAKIEEVVFRILNEFIDDLDLFDELLEDFTSFYEQQQKREEAVDKRTRESEEGKARAELARAMVQQTLNRRLTGRQLPLVAVRLLQEAWRNVLYLNCLREGTESEAWKQSVKVADALVWSVLPQAGAEWQARLKDVAPKLVNSLKKGLAAASYDPLATETLLRELAQVHLELMRGEETRRVAVLDAKVAEKEPDAGHVAVEDVTEAEHVASVVLPTAEPEPEISDALPGDDENVLAVSRLNVGSWVEFMEDESQDRHKLVARIRSIDKLIFANRRGIKVSEMNAMRLAMDMSIGKARIVEEGAVIDRALESVIGSLRDLSTKAAQ